MPVKPLIITMHAAKHSRESAAKGDDQIAFENGISCQEAGRLQSALEWYAEVKPTGGRWDLCASTRRVTLLVATNCPGEAVSVGMNALQRAQRVSEALAMETTRALNANQMPLQALALCRQCLQHPSCQRSSAIWFFAACYASQSRQFARSLRYLARCLDLHDESFGGDMFFDFDLAPLWQHLMNEALTDAEAEALRLPHWQKYRARLKKIREPLSFNSIAHVPPSIRALLRMEPASMSLQPRQHATTKQRALFESWCAAVRKDAWQAFDCGLRKALATHPASNT